MVDISITPEMGLWIAIGFMLARAYGKKMDNQIQSTDWFKHLPKLWQWFLRGSMDFLHHWWIGLLLWFYAPLIALPTGFNMPLQYLGWGIFLDDIPDIPGRFKKHFAYFLKP